MQRRRVEKRLHSGQQRHQHPGGQTKAVKNRKRIKDAVAPMEGRGAVNLLTVCYNIGMAQYYALGNSFRTGGKQDDTWVILADIELTMKTPGSARFQQPCIAKSPINGGMVL